MSPFLAAVTLFVLQSPPLAPRIHHDIESPFGVRTDFYYWLRDSEDPRVIEYLEAENRYAEAFFTGNGDIRETLVTEMADRLPSEDASVPWELDGWWYGTRYEAGAEYPVYFRRPGSSDGPESVLFDMNELARDSEYFSLEGLSVSPDGCIVSLCIDTLGDHRGMIVFLDTRTGVFMEDTLDNASSDMAWGADSRTFFFGYLDETRRTAGFLRYTLGSGESPLEVFYEADSTFWPWMYESRSR